jgi:hypothetical protein
VHRRVEILRERFGRASRVILREERADFGVMSSAGGNCVERFIDGLALLTGPAKFDQIGSDQGAFIDLGRG